VHACSNSHAHRNNQTIRSPLPIFWRTMLACSDLERKAMHRYHMPPHETCAVLTPGLRPMELVDVHFHDCAVLPACYDRLHCDHNFVAFCVNPDARALDPERGREASSQTRRSVMSGLPAISSNMRHNNQHRNTKCASPRDDRSGICAGQDWHTTSRRATSWS